MGTPRFGTPAPGSEETSLPVPLSWGPGGGGQKPTTGAGFGKGPGAGGSHEPLTQRCPCLADVVSCLKRGTHLSQEHTRCVPAPLGAPQPVPSSAPCPQPSLEAGAGLAGGILGVQPQLLCRGEDTFRGTKPPWGVRGVAALTPHPALQRVLPCRLQGHRGGHLGQRPPGLPGRTYRACPPRGVTLGCPQDVAGACHLRPAAGRGQGPGSAPAGRGPGCSDPPLGPRRPRCCARRPCTPG